MRVLLVCFVTLVSLVLASAQSEKAAPDYKTLIGTWNMSSENTGGDPVKWTLILKDQDGKLMGMLATEEGQQPAKNFSYTDGVVKFTVVYQGGDYELQLKPDGNKLDGTWSGGGDSGRTTGVKS